MCNILEMKFLNDKKVLLGDFPQSFWFIHRIQHEKFKTTLHDTDVRVPENVIFTGREPTASSKMLSASGTPHRDIQVRAQIRFHMRSRLVAPLCSSV